MKLRGLDTLEDGPLRLMIRTAGEAHDSQFVASALSAALLAELGRRMAGGGDLVELEVSLEGVESEELFGFQIAMNAEQVVFNRKGWKVAASFCYDLGVQINAELSRRAPPEARGPVH